MSASSRILYLCIWKQCHHFGVILNVVQLTVELLGCNSNLPDFRGGVSTCPAEGGCMQSDMGPWRDPDVLKVILHQPYFIVLVRISWQFSAFISIENKRVSTAC